MKYIFPLLSVLFLQVLSLNVIKPKFCINCKYFITDNDTGKYGKCMLFKIEGEKPYTLVNGNIVENKHEYQYCVVARQMEDKCGLQAKMYKTKYIKKGIWNVKRCKKYMLK